MKFSKPISVEGWQQISERYKNWIDYSHAGMVAKLLDKSEFEFIESIICPALESYTGLKHSIIVAILFFSKPNSRRGLHIDYADEKKYSVKNAWALNIPIVNCNESEMEWYGGNFSKEFHVTSRNLPSYKLIWNSEPELLETAKIDEPTLVYIDYPHDVVHRGNDHRAILSIRTTPNILVFDPTVE